MLLIELTEDDVKFISAILIDQAMQTLRNNPTVSKYCIDLANDINQWNPEWMEFPWPVVSA